MRSGIPALWLALLLSAGFFADVALGAATGASLLSDVSQMLLLFAASIAFVIGTLQRERAARSE
jgi:hypothetical protein